MWNIQAGSLVYTHRDVNIITFVLYLDMYTLEAALALNEPRTLVTTYLQIQSKVIFDMMDYQVCFRCLGLILIVISKQVICGKLND